MLLTAAQSGELDTSKGYQKQVDRLLASPSGSRRERGPNFADMLGFDGFDNPSKDPTIYPKYSFGLATDAQEQTLRTITHQLLAKDGDCHDLFTTRDTFLSRQLGAVYGIPVRKDAPGATPDGWQPYTFPGGRSAFRHIDADQLPGAAFPSRPHFADAARQGAA